MKLAWTFAIDVVLPAPLSHVNHFTAHAMQFPMAHLSVVVVVVPVVGPVVVVVVVVVSIGMVECYLSWNFPQP